MSCSALHTDGHRANAAAGSVVEFHTHAATVNPKTSSNTLTGDVHARNIQNAHTAAIFKPSARLGTAYLHGAANPAGRSTTLSVRAYSDSNSRTGSGNARSHAEQQRATELLSDCQRSKHAQCVRWRHVAPSHISTLPPESAAASRKQMEQND